MKREERNLDGEGDEESKEEPRRSGCEAGNAAATNCLLNDYEIKAADLRIEPNNRGQHEHRSDKSKEEIFYGGVDLAPMAVHADQQRHRNQRRFPEEVKEEQVE